MITQYSIVKILFLNLLLLLLAQPAKHINQTGRKIFNFYVENQSCNPYQCATQAAAQGCTKVSKKSINVLQGEKKQLLLRSLVTLTIVSPVNEIQLNQRQLYVKVTTVLYINVCLHLETAVMSLTLLNFQQMLPHSAVVFTLVPPSNNNNNNNNCFLFSMYSLFF